MAVTKYQPKQVQQGITGPHPPTQFGDSGTAMPGLLSFQQHGSIGEVETPLAQLMAKLMLLTTIHDAEFGQARHQLTAQRKVSAKRAASVVNQREGH